MKLHKEVQQLEKDVLSERFKSHPIEMRQAILRKLSSTKTQEEKSSSVFEDALQQLHDSNIWLASPSRPSESHADGSQSVTMLAREFLVLRAEATEMKAAVEKLKSSSPSSGSDALKPKDAGSQVVPSARMALPLSRVQSIEDGEIVSTLAKEDVDMLDEVQISSSPPLDNDHDLSIRVDELEKRLETIHDLLYQSQDDYKENVDEYLAERITALRVWPGAASLKEKMSDFERIVEEAERRQKVLEQENVALRAQVAFLERKLRMVCTLYRCRMV